MPEPADPSRLVPDVKNDSLLGPMRVDEAAASQPEENERGNAADDRPQVLFAAKYVMERVLGEGGMGQVWAALQVGDVTRPVAVKLLSGAWSSERKAWFRREAQLQASMDHPNIAKVFEAGATQDGQLYLAMELITDGTTITRYCNERRLGLRPRLQLFVTVCRAIQHAHSRLVIHRDIKPSNVLVKMVDGRAEPIVIDFGLAAEIDSAGVDRPAGTLEYMSPEQVGGGAVVDTRSDVFGLGVLFYELLTGVTPVDPGQLPPGGRLDEPAAREELRAAITREAVAPSTRSAADRRLRTDGFDRGGVGANWSRRQRIELDAIAKKALAADPRRRYQTADDFADDVGRHLNDEVVAAVLPRRGYITVKAVRRNRAFLAVFTFLSFFLAATIIVVIRDLNYANVLEERNGVITGQNSQLAASTDSLRAKTSQLGDQLAETRRQLDRSRVVEASAALADGRVPMARARLEEVAPENRGWSWRLLRREAAGPYQYAMLGHAGRVLTFGASADGARLVSVGTDCTIRTWDARDGTEQTRVYTGWQPFTAAAVFPSGKRVVAVDRDGAIRVWDLEAGRVTARYSSPSGHVQALAVSPDGSHVAAAIEGVLIVWEAATGGVAMQLAIKKGSDEQPLNVVLSPGGRHAATRSSSGVCVWDVASGRKSKELPGAGTGGSGAQGLALSADGSTIATGNWFWGGVDIWDVESGRLARTIRPNDSPFIASVALSPDGARVSACQHQTGTYVWDVRSGRLLSYIADASIQSGPVAFAPDTSRVFVAGGEGPIYSLDVRGGAHVVDLGPTRDGPAAFSDDASRVLIPNSQGDIGLWDTRTRAKLRELQTDHIRGFGLNRDGSQAVTISEAGRASVWDMGTGGASRTFSVKCDGSDSAVLSPGGEWLACRADDVLRVYNVQTGAVVVAHAYSNPDVFRSVTTSPLDVVFSADGGTLALRDGSITVYDLPGGGRRRTIDAPCDELLFGNRVRMRLSDDGSRLLASNTSGHGTYVLDTRTGAVLACVRDTMAAEIEVGAFAPGGSDLVCLFSDGTLRVLDVNSGHEAGRISTPIRLHDKGTREIAVTERAVVLVTETGAIYECELWSNDLNPPASEPPAGMVAVSPDGRRAAVNTDGRVRLWDLQTGVWSAELTPSRCGIHRAAFNSNAEKIAVVTDGGGVELFDAASGRRLIILVPPAADSERDDGTVVGLSPDGMVAYVADRKTVTAYDVTSSRVVWKIPYQKWVGSVTTTDDGKRITIAGSVGRASVLDAATGASATGVAPLESRPGLTMDGRFAVGGTGRPLSVPGDPAPIPEAERARRRQLTRPDPTWHANQRDWFDKTGAVHASSFHAAYEQQTRGVAAFESGDFAEARIYFLTAALLRATAENIPESAPHLVK